MDDDDDDSYSVEMVVEMKGEERHREDRGQL